ncbi:hypothetical protein PBI_BRIDGETTE_55 [Arthrobacter phage Bridgette]|uniref:Uncharacterized protein n=1 Tax=Arthrobacter phage Bridgette TaxID=2419949 RepID=A0A3G2KEE3_9CAUD|nr:hypothetical protein HOU46_gp55 [Arthrobacter phage Bridgette]AYN57321.1 hypothetical protein PBI_BRIDGETTE_55 [Arthrobacter phage Bridgette]
MGIYPEYRKANVQYTGGGGLSWTEYRETPGLVEERECTATGWTVKERTNCYCCSCPNEQTCADPACRNHGWAATRPCETHNMPGQPWGEEAGELEGKMPATVQQARALRASEESNGDKAR